MDNNTKACYKPASTVTKVFISKHSIAFIALYVADCQFDVYESMDNMIQMLEDRMIDDQLISDDLAAKLNWQYLGWEVYSYLMAA